MALLLQTDGDGNQRDEPDGVLTVFGIVAWIDQLVEVTADETTTVLSLTKALSILKATNCYPETNDWFNTIYFIFHKI